MIKNKDDTTLFVLITVLLVFVIVICVYNEYGKSECEKSLPRGKECHLVWVAK